MNINWYFFLGGSKQHKRCKMQHSCLDLGRWSFSSVCVEFCFLWQSIGSTSVQSGRFSLPSRIVDGFLGGPCPPSSSHVWNRCHPPSSLKMATRLLIGAVFSEFWEKTKMSWLRPAFHHCFSTFFPFHGGLGIKLAIQSIPFFLHFWKQSAWTTKSADKSFFNRSCPHSHTSSNRPY